MMNKELPGTQRDRFKLLLDFAGYKIGDIIESHTGESIEILKELGKGSYFDFHGSFEYIAVYPAFIGEELEIAYSHFQFLKRFNLV